MAQFIWLLVSIIGAYVGYRLLRIGLQRGVKPGNVTRCATCEYDLTANVSGVCPECGQATDGNVIRGRYFRSWGLCVFAVGILVLSVWSTWQNWQSPLTTRFWFRHAPVRALLWQTSGSVAPLAWQELERRLWSGELDAPQEVELARWASDQPKNTYFYWRAASYLAHLAEKGRLDADLCGRLKSMMPSTGPTITLSGPTSDHRIPVCTRYATPANPGRIWIHLDYEFRVDNANEVVWRNTFTNCLGSSVTLGADLLPPQQPGEHAVKGTFRFHVYLGKEGDYVGSQWLFMVERTATATFRIPQAP